MDQNPPSIGSHLWLGNPGSNVTKDAFLKQKEAGSHLDRVKAQLWASADPKLTLLCQLNQKPLTGKLKEHLAHGQLKKFATFWQNKSGKMSLHSQMPEDGRSVPPLPTTMFVTFMKPVNIQSLSTMLAGDLSRGSKKNHSQGRHRPSSQTYLFWEQNH